MSFRIVGGVAEPGLLPDSVIYDALGNTSRTWTPMGRAEAGHRLAASIAANSEVHKHGLLMLSAGQSCEPDDVRRMLLNDEPVGKRYGAIAAKHLRYKHPELLELAAGLPESDVRRFATEA